MIVFCFDPVSNFFLKDRLLWFEADIVKRLYLRHYAGISTCFTPNKRLQFSLSAHILEIMNIFIFVGK